MSDSLQTPDLTRAVVAEQMHLQVPSRPDWIEATVEYLRQRALLSGVCAASRAGRMMLALQEALSNAIVHGNLEVSSELKEKGDNAFAEALALRAADPAYSSRVVDVLVDCNTERCQWAITDQGPGFDFQTFLTRAASDDPDLLLASGRGLLLMRSFMDDLHYEAGGRRVVLTLQRSSGEEKRQAPRIGVHAALRVAPIRADGSVDWEAACAAVSRNFSSGGVSLVQTQLAACDRIMIGLHSGKQPVYLPAEVRHWRTLGQDIIELGCRFQMEQGTAPAGETEEPPAEVLSAVGDLLEHSRTPTLREDERRAYQRVLYSERIQILVKPGESPLLGYARDLSRGGVAFLATAALPSEVTLLFPSPTGEAPLCLRSRVIRCSKVQDGFYDIGAKFLTVERTQGA